jgi:hypothetical protein
MDGISSLPFTFYFLLGHWALGNLRRGKGERGKGKGMEIKSYLNHSGNIFLTLFPSEDPLSPLPNALK